MPDCGNIGDALQIITYGEVPVFDANCNEIGFWRPSEGGAICSGQIHWLQGADQSIPPDQWNTWDTLGVNFNTSVTNFCLSKGYTPPWIQAQSGDTITVPQPGGGAQILYKQPDGNYDTTPPGYGLNIPGLLAGSSTWVVAGLVAFLFLMLLTRRR